MKVATIVENKNGSKKVVFSKLGIYNCIKEQLGIRYIKLNRKGYYIKLVKGEYHKCSFYDLWRAFRNFIENEFENLEIDGDIDWLQFLEAYMEQRPLKDYYILRDYLSYNFKISEEELHLFRMKIDTKYKYTFKNNEILEYLKELQFKQKIDSKGTFLKGQNLYYKNLDSESYLVIYFSSLKKKSEEPIYHVWEVKNYNVEDKIDIKKIEKEWKYTFHTKSEIEEYLDSCFN